MLTHLQAVLAHWDIPPVTAKHLSFLTLKRCFAAVQHDKIYLSQPKCSPGHSLLFSTLNSALLTLNS
jgi:hypothetical protein